MENRVGLNLLDETFADAFAYLPKKGEAHFFAKAGENSGVPLLKH
jgi:hypothetical protein